MRTLSQLNGADFLRQCYKIAGKCGDILKDTHIMEFRKVRPAFTGKETNQQRLEMTQQQGIKNTRAMVDYLMSERADKAAELLELFVIPEDDQEVTGIDCAIAGIEVLGNPKVLGFLSSLMKSGLVDTDS